MLVLKVLIDIMWKNNYGSEIKYGKNKVQQQQKKTGFFNAGLFDANMFWI